MTENCRTKTARFFGLTFFPSLPFFGAAAAAAFLLRRSDPRDEHLLAAERGNGGVRGVSDALAGDGLSTARAARIRKCRHESLFAERAGPSYLCNEPRYLLFHRFPRYLFYRRQTLFDFTQPAHAERQHPFLDRLAAQLES